MKRWLLLAVLLCGTVRAAENRAGEILERLAAGFRAMKGYEVTFEVEAGEYRTGGSYAVEGQGYFLTLGDAEVFCDGTVRYEVDNARREVTIVGVDTASRNILNNPVKAFDFLDSEYDPELLTETAGRAVVRLTPTAGNSSPCWITTTTASGCGSRSAGCRRSAVRCGRSTGNAAKATSSSTSGNRCVYPCLDTGLL